MPRELITIQVGQCGLQLGSNFWELALREHANYNASLSKTNNKPTFDDSMSSFFRNVDAKTNKPIVSSSSSPPPIHTLRARAILIDMESGVLDELMGSKSEFSTLFDRSLSVSSVSGSGNNFSQGFYEYGPKYKSAILNSIHKCMEDCDSLQAFLLIHSLGGGTGSGLGSYIVNLLHNEFPEILRFVNSVYPSPISDVITSPYNSLFASNQLIQHADAVLTVDNQALTKLSNAIYGNKSNSDKESKSNNMQLFTSSKKAGFSDMNLICGELLCGLTASMRFPGQLNTDLNEITMNLVPYPNLHFLMPSISPLLPCTANTNMNSNINTPSIGIDSLFTSLLHPDAQLLSFNQLNVKQSIYLSFGLLCRGINLSISDINRGVKLIKSNIKMPIWNLDGFKIGLCNIPNARKINTILGLANSSSMYEILESNVYNRFNVLYKRRAHIHHYTEFMEEEEITQAIENVKKIIQDYKNIAKKGTYTNNNKEQEIEQINQTRYMPAI